MFAADVPWDVSFTGRLGACLAVGGCVLRWGRVSLAQQAVVLLELLSSPGGRWSKGVFFSGIAAAVKKRVFGG